MAGRGGCYLQSAVRQISIAAFVVLLAIAGCQHGPADPPADEKTSAAVKSRNSDDGTAAKVREPETEPPFQLVEIPPETSGIRFRHVSGNAADKPFPAANGSGVGALDYDLDGRRDLYFATGTSFPLDATRRGPVNRMYRNLGGWKFDDVSQQTGLDHNGYSSGIAVGDFDADGFPDVYVTCFGANRLYRNCGDGSFADVEMKADAGVFSTSAAFFDYDGDGLLDLYVCNYGTWSYERNRFCGDRSRGIRKFCSPKSLKPERDVLLRNEGDGTFRDVTAQAGLDKQIGRGQGVLATDVNGDGKIDLYLGNDIHPNFLYLNQGNGRFRDLSEASGTAYDSDGRMQAGMGVAGADVDRDGRWDLFVTNFDGEHSTLYLQSAGDVFNDVSSTSGIAAASKPWVGWGTAFVDFDLDGWKDLIVTNGHVDDNLKAFGQDSPYEQPALVWRNVRGRFRLLGESAGRYLRRPHAGRGLAVVDLDNDGAADVVVTHQDQPPALLRNVVKPRGGRGGRSITLRLVGTRSNRDAIGSRVVVASHTAPRVEQIQGGGSYLSAHDLRLTVAVEDGRPAIDVEITWPSGRRDALKGMTPGYQYDILEPSGGSSSSRPRLMKRPFQSSAQGPHL